MQGAKQVRTFRRSTPRTIVRSAWLILLIAFALFCSLITSSGYMFWRYRTYALAEQGGMLIARAPMDSITWKRRERTTFERPADTETPISEGTQVRINQLAGYGQAATIRLFDLSTLDMWAGSDLLLQTLQTSHWSNHEQIVVLQQTGGYVRYDLRDDQSYRHVSFRVIIGEASVDFAPGGSYSIVMGPPERQVLLPDGSAPFPVADVAVRTGRAVVLGAADHRVTLTAGQRVQVDPVGIPSLPVPARWELIRDGNFNRYSQEEYNNTTEPHEDQPALRRADTWHVFGERTDPRANSSGFFQLSRGCPPPNPTNDCDPREWRNAAWFIRTGNEPRSFSTGVEQVLGSNQRGIDISEYRSLVLSAWVRVLHQSVPLAGEQGTECPVMLRLWARRNSPSDPDEQRMLCVYSSTDPVAEPVRDPGLVYHRVEPYKWDHVQIELRDGEWLPDFKYLWKIRLYANGHDYDSRVTEVSLIGSHVDE